MVDGGGPPLGPVGPKNALSDECPAMSPKVSLHENMLEPFKRGLGPNKYPGDIKCIWG